MHKLAIFAVLQRTQLSAECYLTTGWNGSSARRIDNFYWTSGLAQRLAHFFFRTYPLYCNWKFYLEVFFRDPRKLIRESIVFLLFLRTLQFRSRPTPYSTHLKSTTKSVSVALSPFFLGSGMLRRSYDAIFLRKSDFLVDIRACRIPFHDRCNVHC